MCLEMRPKLPFGVITIDFTGGFIDFMDLQKKKKLEKQSKLERKHITNFTFLI